MADPLWLFVIGAFLGDMVETVFWDYSKFKFNLGGRINLLYYFFWGIAAVMWMRYGYPDEHFDNARMEHIYPNAKKSDQGRINPIFPLALLLENRYNILWIKGSKGRTLVEKRVRCAAATPPAEMPDAVPDA